MGAIIPKAIALPLALTVCLCSSALSQDVSDRQQTSNRPEREDWFMDQALGMFIHWSVDSQLGSVISHSMVGASDEYVERFMTELPRSYNPEEFDPANWASLARLAGFKYVVFTTKHHSGFCNFKTSTTDFNIMNTPYGKDITKQVVEAFRKEGLSVGFYFSPEDFAFLYKEGITISRRREEAQPGNIPALLKHNRRQLKELLSNYGKIDMVFLDAFDNEDAKLYCWQLDPDVIITRGQMETPEQKMPDEPMPGPWEACFTLGTQWQYKPTHEDYKSGSTLIQMLIEIRAKGGNFLLNIGPTPEGEIPFEQKRRARELALWMFVNREAIYRVRPWSVIREGDTWFTKSKDSDTVYAFLPNGDWPRGQRREFTLKSVRSTDATAVSVLGQSGKVVEYQPDKDGTTTWEQTEEGLKVSVVRAQRLYNDHKWPNPITLKITNAKAAQ